VDPNLDPELALALRVSMEEERARQEAAAKKAAEDAANQEKGGEQQASSQDATMSERASAATSEAENKTSDLMVGVFFLHYLLVQLHAFLLAQLEYYNMRAYNCWLLVHLVGLLVVIVE